MQANSQDECRRNARRHHLLGERAQRLGDARHGRELQRPVLLVDERRRPDLNHLGRGRNRALAHRALHPSAASRMARRTMLRGFPLAPDFPRSGFVYRRARRGQHTCSPGGSPRACPPMPSRSSSSGPWTQRTHSQARSSASPPNTPGAQIARRLQWLDEMAGNRVGTFARQSKGALSEL